MPTTGRPISLAHLTVLDATPPELVTVAADAGFRSIGIRLTATPSVGVPPYDILSDGPVLRETLRRLADTGVSVLDTEFLRFEPEHPKGIPDGFRSIGIRLTATPSVGVPPYDILSDGPLLRETLRRLADTGVSVLDTEFLRFEPERPKGIPDGFLEVSARLGARNVLVMSAEPEESRTLERLGELCDRAAGYGLQVCLEFAIYTGVRTLAHAADVVARSKRSNASVLIDALHWSRSGGIPAHVKQVDPSLLRYVQICDAGPDMPGPTDTPALIREARTGRLLPGEGVLPLAELVGALPPTVPLAIEAPCRATAELPAAERAKRAYRALTALLEKS